MLKVEHFQADIEALEEEVERWKEAATEEAAAGAAVFEDVERCQDEVSLVFNVYLYHICILKVECIAVTACLLRWISMLMLHMHRHNMSEICEEIIA